VRAGYALGAGWEQMVANWSVKLEYLYTSFDRVGIDHTILASNGASQASGLRGEIPRHQQLRTPSSQMQKALARPGLL
jgi:opacity protein-like surface antigen